MNIIFKDTGTAGGIDAEVDPFTITVSEEGTVEFGGEDGEMYSYLKFSPKEMFQISVVAAVITTSAELAWAVVSASISLEEEGTDATVLGDEYEFEMTSEWARAMGLIMGALGSLYLDIKPFSEEQKHLSGPFETAFYEGQAVGLDLDQVMSLLGVPEDLIEPTKGSINLTSLDAMGLGITLYNPDMTYAEYVENDRSYFDE